MKTVELIKFGDYFNIKGKTPIDIEAKIMDDEIIDIDSCNTKVQSSFICPVLNLIKEQEEYQKDIYLAKVDGKLIIQRIGWCTKAPVLFNCYYNREKLNKDAWYNTKLSERGTLLFRRRIYFNTNNVLYPLMLL